MSLIRQVLYVSQARRDLRPTDIHEILQTAYKQNKLHGVTGLLLHNRGQFCQVIEGQSDAIEQLLKNLRSDTRHEYISVLVDEMKPEPEFICWLMNYRDVSKTFDPMIDNEDLIDTSFLLDIPSPSKTVQLLKTFIKLP